MKIIRIIKRKVKDELMLALFNSELGSFSNMKRASNKFDDVYITIQMRLIIWLLSLTFSVLLFIYFRYLEISLWVSIPLTFICIYILKEMLIIIGRSLIGMRFKAE